jgi:hypothetical protein
MFLYIIVIVWRGVCAQSSLEVQIVEAQVADSGSSSGNMSDESAPHDQKSTQKGVFWSDDLKMPQRVKFPSFIANKELSLNIMLKRLFPFCKNLGMSLL